MSETEEGAGTREVMLRRIAVAVAAFMGDDVDAKADAVLDLVCDVEPSGVFGVVAGLANALAAQVVGAAPPLEPGDFFGMRMVDQRGMPVDIDRVDTGVRDASRLLVALANEDYETAFAIFRAAYFQETPVAIVDILVALLEPVSELVASGLRPKG